MGKYTHVLQAEELATRRNSIRPPCSKLKARRGRPPGRQGSARTLEDRDLPGGVAPTIASGRAPCLIDGPINGERFLVYVEQFLAPTLKPTTSWWPTIWDLTRKGHSQSDQGSRRARLLFLPGTCPTQPHRAGLSKTKNARPKGDAANLLDGTSDALAVRFRRKGSLVPPVSPWVWSEN
jgi:hypothetical protein